MKKINWQFGDSGSYEYARIGSVTLYCNRILTKTLSCRWVATVRIHLYGQPVRRGQIRYSIGKARKDAVELAREILLDFNAGLMAEMRNFGLEVS